MLLMKVSKCWKVAEFRKISTKMKNYKTFYECQTASRLKEIFQPSQIKSYYVFETKIFLVRYTEIYRHLLLKCSKNAVLGRQEMVQCKYFFWHKTETCLLENLKNEKGFWLCFGNILFSMSNELSFAKWVRFFEQDCIVKWVIFFATFYWLWDFLLGNLE